MWLKFENNLADSSGKSNHLDFQGLCLGSCNAFVPGVVDKAVQQVIQITFLN